MSILSSETTFRRTLTRRLIDLYQNHEWQLVGIGYLVAFTLGTHGFFRYFDGSIPGATQFERGLHLVYLTAQLFILESGLDAGARVPLTLQLARLLAPAVLGFTAVTAVLTLFGEKIESLRLRGARGHIVVCGLGRKGMQLVKEYRDRKERVVAVEADAENDNVESARSLGATVAVGNAAEESLLTQIGVHRARAMYTVCGDQGSNIEIAVRARQLVGRTRRPRRVRCHVHLTDPALCHLLSTHRVFSDRNDMLDMSILNTNDIAARLLFQEHPLDFRPLKDQDRVHLIVAGFGGMGESVTLQAARIGHFAGHRRVRITVLDREANGKGRLFLDRYPSFRETADIDFLEMDFGSADFRDAIARAAGENDVLLSAAICVNDNTAALDYALALYPLVETRNIPIHVRLDTATGLAWLLQDGPEATEIAQQLHPFGQLSRTCSPSVIERGDLDRLARRIHRNHVTSRLAQAHSPDDPSLKPWDDLDPSLRDSNRHQADHIPVKLRAVGCRLEPTNSDRPSVTEFEESEVPVLAAVEHDRWNAERFLDGWRFGPEKNIEQKISPYLVAWEELPADIQDYDIKAVKAIPALAAAMDMKVCRCNYPRAANRSAR